MAANPFLPAKNEHTPGMPAALLNMSCNSKREYLLAIWERYQRLGKQFNGKVPMSFVKFAAACQSVLHGAQPWLEGGGD